MVVRIIKHGSLAKEPVCYSICNNCGCHFTFAKRDAERLDPFDNKGYFFITCPTKDCDAVIEALGEEFRNDPTKSGEPS